MNELRAPGTPIRGQSHWCMTATRSGRPCYNVVRDDSDRCRAGHVNKFRASSPTATSDNSITPTDTAERLESLSVEDVSGSAELPPWVSDDPLESAYADSVVRSFARCLQCAYWQDDNKRLCGKLARGHLGSPIWEHANTDAREASLNVARWTLTTLRNTEPKLGAAMGEPGGLQLIGAVADSIYAELLLGGGLPSMNCLPYVEVEPELRRRSLRAVQSVSPTRFAALADQLDKGARQVEEFSTRGASGTSPGAWTYEEEKGGDIVDRLLERCSAYADGKTCSERDVAPEDMCERCIAAAEIKKLRHTTSA
jgi:hypothetical protein